MSENKRASGGFVGTAIGAAMTAMQGTHPEWFGNHPWILPFSLLILLGSLLFWLTQYRWMQKLLSSEKTPPLDLKALRTDVDQVREQHAELRRDLQQAKTETPSISSNGVPVVGPAAHAAERERNEAANRPLSSLFSPLQIEAFEISKDLRDFLASMPPFPSDPTPNPGENNPEYLTRFHQVRTEEQGKWRMKLMHGYASKRFGSRITALMHRLGAEVEYPAYVPDYAEKPPMDQDGVSKLAQEMEMIAIWISRKKRNEVNLLGQARVQ